MGTILDLSVFMDDQTFDVKLKGDEVLHIRKPTEGMIIKLIQYGRLANADVDEEKQLQAINALTVRILNDNQEGVEFTPESVAQLPITAKGALITGYSEFATGIQSDPT